MSADDALASQTYLPAPEDRGQTTNAEPTRVSPQTARRVRRDGPGGTRTFTCVTDFGSREDKPGEMGRMARTLADAGINVSLVYLATRSRGVLATSDNAKARQLLGL